jgi:hypothetical protein
MRTLHAKEHPWLKLAAIKEMMDRLWGKSQQHISLDTDATIATVYESIDDIRRDVIESGLPLDHLEAPRLLTFPKGLSGLSILSGTSNVCVKP